MDGPKRSRLGDGPSEDSNRTSPATVKCDSCGSTDHYTNECLPKQILAPLGAFDPSKDLKSLALPANVKNEPGIIKTGLEDEEVGKAARRFFGVAELTSKVAMLVTNRRDLANLCLTCKALNGASTTALYEEVDINDENWHTFLTIDFSKPYFPTVASNKCFGLTRSLTVTLRYKPARLLRRELMAAQRGIAEVLYTIVKFATNLRVLRLNGWPLPEDISQRLSDLLRKNTSIKHFTKLMTDRRKRFDGDPDEMPASSFSEDDNDSDGDWKVKKQVEPVDLKSNHSIPRSALDKYIPQNLTSLTLLEILLPNNSDMTSLPQCIELITSALVSSPQLVNLALGMAEISSYNWKEEYVILNDRQYRVAELLSLFRDIVEKFHQKGGKQLKLRSLRLGHGMLLLSPDGLDWNLPEDERTMVPEDPDDFYLSKLTDPGLLQVLSFDNRGGFDLRDPWNDIGGDDTGAIAWAAVKSAYFPKLQEFTFTQLNYTSKNWLRLHREPDFISNLLLGLGTDPNFSDWPRNINRQLNQDNEANVLEEGDVAIDESQDLFSLELLNHDRSDQPDKNPLGDIRPRGLLLPRFTGRHDLDVALSSLGHVTMLGLHLTPNLVSWVRTKNKLEALGRIRNVEYIWIMNEADMPADERSELRKGSCKKWEACADASAKTNLRKPLEKRNHSSHTICLPFCVRYPTTPYWPGPMRWHTVAKIIASGAAHPESSLRFVKVGPVAFKIDREPKSVDCETGVTMSPLTAWEQRDLEPSFFNDSHLGQDRYAHVNWNDGPWTQHYRQHF